MATSVASLTQIIYVSSAASLMSDDELMAILSASRRNNGRDQITGMLVYSEGSFLQVLEGDDAALERASARIFADPRHRSAITLLRRTIEERSFGDWSMGFARASRADLLAVPGCNDFFAGGACLADVDEGRAKKLLENFRAKNR